MTSAGPSVSGAYGSRPWLGATWRRRSWGEREEVQNEECRVQNGGRAENAECGAVREG
jgi:hypothetical protein